MKVLVLLCVLASSALFAQTKAKLKYPAISLINGKIDLEVFMDGGQKPKALVATRGMVLEDTVHFVTHDKSQVRIELDENSSFILLENSELKLPAIIPETGEVTEIMLLSGSLRAQQMQNCSERIYSTPVSRDPYGKADFLLKYEPEHLLAKVVLFAGDLEFRGMNFETSVHVKTGEQAEFQGILEDGKLAFDVLLKGRKVIRGKLSPAKTLPAAEIATMDKATMVQKPPPPKPKPKPKPKPGEICEGPFAKLNDCVWRCQGPKNQQKKGICDTTAAAKTPLKCVRERCDANGRWIDSFILPKGEGRCLGGQDLVAPCDY